MRLVPLVLLGFGNVGQAVGKLLLRKQAEIAESRNLSYRVVGIGTGSHGFAIDHAGLDLAQCLEIVSRGGSLKTLSAGPAIENSMELLKQSAAEALLESTPVDYEAGQPATDYLEAALRLGMHAITANKGPVVHGYRRLTKLAEGQRRQFRFESAVMDGAPVFSMWRASLPGARLQSFRGVLNSTTNFILTEMEAGQSLDSAVSHAQQIGVAETDPSGDIEGWDAAVKVAALVNVLMDYPLQLAQVERTGIQQLTEDTVRQAHADGKRWKLVCSAERQADGVRAMVGPQLIGPADPLFGVSGTSSAVSFTTDVLGELTLTESDPGPHTTAYGMLADLLSVSEVL